MDTAQASDGAPARTTRERIMAAASTELARAGFAGARMETIARLAGVKKQVIYYYYPSKVELARAVLEKSNDDAAGLWAMFPTSTLSEICHAAIDQSVESSEGVAHLVWEGQEYANEHSSDFPIGPSRAANLQKIVAVVKAEQSAGRLPTNIAADYFGLLIVLLTTAPAILPQVTDIIVGRNVQDPEFAQGWHALLDHVLEALHP
ncbi:TetR/AcrR family transcriptional regulator [Nocardia fluminea]|uniref:TetR/AcrR family transcriptional regulator n=1 Tax=Nocardia fluminea TaxID=134984 RepID=UPI0034333945